MAAGSHLGGSGESRLTCGAGSRGGAAGEPPPGGRPGRIPPAAGGGGGGRERQRPEEPRPGRHVAPVTPGRAGPGRRERNTAAGKAPLPGSGKARSSQAERYGRAGASRQVLWRKAQE